MSQMPPPFPSYPPVMHVIGIVEGIMYLTKSDQQFYEMYIANRKEWF
jgi:hypothetical protein